MLFSNDAVRSFTVAFAVIAAVVAASCDKVPLTSPTGSTITLSIDKSILPVNGQATVTAVVTESAGTAVQNGTTVTFSPSMGRVDPVEALTLNGKAVVTFVAPSTSGTAVINAFSGSASTGSGNSSGGGVQVRVGSAAIGGVTVNVTPSTVPQNGGTVTATALAVDTANNPLPGVAVLFSTDQGTLGSTSVFTDANGNASTTLTTNRVTKITATVGASKGEFTVNVVTAPTVGIVSNTATPIVGSPVSFTVTPTTATTANPIQRIVVDFGDGQTTTLNGVTGPTGLTHTYNRADGYTVTATAYDINGQPGFSSVAIVVTRPSAPTITFTQTSSTTPAATPAIPESFSISATPAAPATIQSIVVTRASNGQVLYSGSGGGSFAASVSQNEILTAVATDSAGNSSTSQLVVQ